MTHSVEFYIKICHDYICLDTLFGKLLSLETGTSMTNRKFQTEHVHGSEINCVWHLKPHYKKNDFLECL